MKMNPRHDFFCEDSAALGEGFPNLAGGAIGVAVGLVRGSMLLARRLAEGAIWMDGGCSCGRSCRCGVVHRVTITDCGPRRCC
jgi:hypothetical protein